MEVVVMASGDYERFEDLLLQREQLEKEATGFEIAYRREFGELMVESYKVKIDCIALKKSISYCQAVKNHGEKVDEDEMRAAIERQMSAYRNKLGEMVKDYKASRSGKPISAYQIHEIKKIYRRIVKMLHPDINTLTQDYPELMDLFQRAMKAYHGNRLKELQEVEVLINKFLKDQGIIRVECSIPNLQDRILELEEEIDYILTHEPYLYRELLDDPKQVEALKKKLQEEIESYKDYKTRLEKALETILDGGEVDWQTIMN